MEKHFQNLWKAWAVECGLEGLEPEAGEPWVVGYDDLMITSFLDQEGRVHLVSHLAPWPEEGAPAAARLLLADNARSRTPWPRRAYLDAEAGSLALTVWAPVSVLTEPAFIAFVDGFSAHGRGLVAALAKIQAEKAASDTPDRLIPEGGLRL